MYQQVLPLQCCLVCSQSQDNILITSEVSRWHLLIYIANTLLICTLKSKFCRMHLTWFTGYITAQAPHLRSERVQEDLCPI